MLASTRVIRRPCKTVSLRLHQPPRLSRHFSPPTRQLHTGSRQFPRPKRSSQPILVSQPRRAALDPLTLLLAATLATAVAYLATQYPFHKAANPDAAAAKEEEISVAQPSAHLFPLTMAPNMPPGRPGALTAEQEAKLKEMWMATLEIFGVSHETHLNGGGSGGAAADTAGGGSSSPESKKKKRSRLSMFRKKDKDGGDGGGMDDAASSTENDKHGQTKEFQQALASQSPEALREAFWAMTKHDHPDALLLRFLRARKWDVHAAIVMMISTLHWRMEEMRVDDDIMKNGEEGAWKESKSSNASEKKEGEDFIAQLRMGKSFLHGADKEGRPCCYCRVRLHRPGQQTEKSLERFTVYTIETTRMMLRPPVDTATIVFDMTDFSMSNMDYTPVKFMIKCFEANYPESLGSVLVYKAPWIFSGIWKIIKGWLDPVVASKIHFASDVHELEEWIPRNRIMKELGGDEDFVYTYVEPVEGENAQMADTASRDKIISERSELAKSYEADTLTWAHGEDGGEGRGRLAERLAENYWKLDPFIRARSLYDRTGVLGSAGKLDFYPSAASAAAGAKETTEDDLD